MAPGDEAEPFHNPEACDARLCDFRQKYPDKFVSEESVFSRIHPGARIFLGTGCGEPQYLVSALMKFVEGHPAAFFDAEVLQVWTLGVAPYTEPRFACNFRSNSFFIGQGTRAPVNDGTADYTPMFMYRVPALFHRKLVPVDIALVQTTPPDSRGHMSLGVSVDIVKAAVENASLVVAQVNCHMPRVHGDTFIRVQDVDYVVPRNEPLLEYPSEAPDAVALRIGKQVARLVADGDTIQVGYGGLPDAILSAFRDKKHLGVHTELFTDGIADLMRRGVVDNTRKRIEHEKSLATFCMGRRSTYEYIHDNPAVEFKPAEYVNNPLVIAQNPNLCAINTALEIDLTGQATADSLGTTFFSGIGGHADFMRGAALSPGGKAILAIRSTASGGQVSRIVPTLKGGAGVTLTRGDIHYVVTEYGIAYLHGKNVRERALDLIAIAHPRFRPWLIEEARRLNLIYRDQAFIPGKRGEYPEHLETSRTTRTDLVVGLRPVKLTDEPLLKDFFYSLSENTLYRRFIQMRKEIPHEWLQNLSVIDYTREMVILATLREEERELVVGVGQFAIGEHSNYGEVAFVVRDAYQNRGIGWELLSYLTLLARKSGLAGFTAEVLVENLPMMHLFEKSNFDIHRKTDGSVYDLRMGFRGEGR